MQHIPNWVRTQCRQESLPLAQVIDIFECLKSSHEQARSYDNSIRMEVWQRYAYSIDSYPFWRHGMRVVYRQAFEDGDMTNIVRWDECADEMGWDSQELFDFIRSDYIRHKPDAEFWNEAIAEAACYQERITSDSTVPF